MELNPEQKLVVEHDEGPLLIIAGAGTGKTRAITERIVHLIETGKAKPGEILALTFTEKAANEMVERVDKKMPLGYEECSIKTFHSFSEKILRESGLEMGIDPGFKILGQVEQWFFFKQNLYSFSLDYYRPLGNPNSFIYELLTHFGKLKDELIAPSEYLKFTEKIGGDDGKKIKEIATVFQEYQDLLIKNNYLDFADLTYLGLQLLEKRPGVLAEYQNRYKYILVDEFQDTNYAQFKLLLDLSKNHKNIVAVGDDDQSIYKWRGASLSNILKFDEEFAEHKKIVLIENYRSTKNILDAAYNLIQNNNPDRLESKTGLNKQLNCNVEGAEPVEIHHFPTFLEESVFVAEKIQFLQKEGVDLADIAILVRNNNHAIPFTEELKYLAIPYQVRNPKGLMSLAEIKDLIAVTKFLANPNDDIAMLRILKMDVFGIPMTDILELLNGSKKNHLFKLIKQRLEGENMVIPGAEDPLQIVYDLLLKLIDFSKKNSVGIVINEFLTKSKHLNYLVESEKYEEMDNINQFAKRVAKFERDSEHNSVIDFSAYIDLLNEANAPLSYGDSQTKDSVQILTCHGSKGLQFKYVFIVNLVNQRFPTGKRWEPFYVPEDLTKEIFPEGDFHLQEERRLFYVAMTRAKEKVFLSYSDQYEGNKKWKVSPFVGEVEDSGYGIRTDHSASEDSVKKLQEFKSPVTPIFNLPPFKSKRVSYSQLDTFKSCPLKYNYRYIMKVPTPPSHAANFGSSVHETLNEFYKLLKKGEKVSLEKLKELYEKSWIPYGFESKEHEGIRYDKGLEMLTKFYETNSNPWVVPAFLERPFNLKLGEYMLSGRIDRIDKLDDGTYEVIDYKTGRMKSNPNLKNDLQLSIYALACRDIFGIQVSKLSLYYLEDNEKISTERTDEQLNKIVNDVEETVSELKRSDFNPTPGFLCRFCDYRLICPAV